MCLQTHAKLVIATSYLSLVVSIQFWPLTSLELTRSLYTLDMVLMLLEFQCSSSSLWTTLTCSPFGSNNTVHQVQSHFTPFVLTHSEPRLLVVCMPHSCCSVAGCLALCVDRLFSSVPNKAASEHRLLAAGADRSTAICFLGGCGRWRALWPRQDAVFSSFDVTLHPPPARSCSAGGAQLDDRTQKENVLCIFLLCGEFPPESVLYCLVPRRMDDCLRCRANTSVHVKRAGS